MSVANYWVVSATVIEPRPGHPAGERLIALTQPRARVIAEQAEPRLAAVTLG